MARAMELEFLLVIPRYFVYIALLAWLAAFSGLVYKLARRLLVFLNKQGLPKL